LLWMVLQAILSNQGFYSESLDAVPPRFPLVLGPPLLVIIGVFFTKSGQNFLNSLSLSTLTYLHTIRIPVELILFALFTYKAIPELMTFEGRNWDILAGITAPLVAYWGIQKGKMGRTALLLWNILCLGLLFNIIFHAILSIPFPFQQFAFDQPNLAVLHFPYVWLPGVIVPIVLFSHFASIRHLVIKV
ncbi:MAG: hypothetical protein AAGA10_28345, partial [Bacteroidota bacterium]